MRPHRRQPTRLHHPWDSPGKNTGVSCQFLLQCMKVKSKREVAQSCPTLRDPMDCSLPGSSVHGTFQARVLEWGAIAFSAFVAATYENPLTITDFVDVQSCPTLFDPMDCSLPGSSILGILQTRTLEWVALSFSRGFSQPGDQTLLDRWILYYWVTRQAPCLPFSQTPKL